MRMGSYGREKTGCDLWSRQMRVFFKFFILGKYLLGSVCLSSMHPLNIHHLFATTLWSYVTIELHFLGLM